MPNLLNANGLTTKTQAELVAEFTLAFQEIYGADINLDQDTPDGQMMMIYIQGYLDLLDLVKQVYSSFSPDNALGRVLDMRVAINGIQRQAGTYTITPIDITVDKQVNLFGVDQTTEEVFTVQDDAGTQWVLIESVSILVAGTTTHNFRALLPGKTLTIPGTIKSPVTITLGVTGINNGSAAISIGLAEESDYDLKIRRQKSVSLASQGYKEGLVAALENINGITSAFVHENLTDAVNSDGQPGHSIWVIVAGTYEASEVADAIYKKRNAGCGMYGEISYIITQRDNSLFEVLWDEVDTEDVFIEMNITPIDSVILPNIEAIRTQLPALLTPGVNQKLNINALSTLVQQIDGNALVQSEGFSSADSGPFVPVISPSSKKNQFIVKAENIIITPMQMKPVNPNMIINDTRQFVAYGGYGALTFTLDSNNTGGEYLNRWLLYLWEYSRS